MHFNGFRCYAALFHGVVRVLYSGMKRKQMHTDRAPDSWLDTSIRFYNAFADTC